MASPREHSKCITVVLADDHGVFRLGLREFLTELPDVEVIAEAADGNAAVSKAIECKPDVVMMDIRMPEKDGIQATREIRARLPQTEVVVLSALGSEDQVIEALEAGARGYLLKDDEPDAMVKAIRTASAGQLYLGPTLAKRVLERLAREPVIPQRPHAAPHGALTEGEVIILRDLTEGKRVREIADAFGVSERTMRNRLRTIFMKLGVRDRTQAVLQAIRSGLVQL